MHSCIDEYQLQLTPSSGRIIANIDRPKIVTTTFQKVEVTGQKCANRLYGTCINFSTDAVISYFLRPSGPK
jgi:hypothetical protein